MLLGARILSLSNKWGASVFPLISSLIKQQLDILRRLDNNLKPNTLLYEYSREESWKY